MLVLYAALFLACLVGVCWVVVIADKLHRIYIEWLGSADIFTHDELTFAARPVHMESVLMHRQAFIGVAARACLNLKS